MNPSGKELTDQSFRIDEEIDDALMAYCERSETNMNKAIADAVANYEDWCNEGGPQKEKDTHHVFLRNAKNIRRGRTRTILRATKLSARTMRSIGVLRGKRSIALSVWEQV
jgi:hypothetical protein